MADGQDVEDALEGSWVDRAWSEALLDRREILILASRSEKTLDEIGKMFSPPLTRERVRQLESAATKKLRGSLANEAPTSLEHFRQAVRGAPVLATQEVSALLPSVSTVRTAVVARVLGLSPARGWGQLVPGLWTASQANLDEVLKSIALVLPFAVEDLESVATAAGSQDAKAIAMLLETPNSPARRHSDSWWVRRRAQCRDAMYLFLLAQGEAQPTSVLSAKLGMSSPALREQLRRDDRFHQMRPSGVWALTQWGGGNTGGPRNAAEAVVALLDRFGAMTLDAIMRELRDFYPVTVWRVHQVLASETIGRHADGTYGLVRHGAPPQLGQEPPPHPSVSVSADGLLVGYRQVVTRDVLRGSGLACPRYLAWTVGAGGIPSSSSFHLHGAEDVLIIRNGTSHAQLSSLRKIALQLGTEEGCVIGLIFRLAGSTVRAVHGCEQSSCPSVAGIAGGGQGAGG